MVYSPDGRNHVSKVGMDSTYFSDFQGYVIEKLQQRQAELGVPSVSYAKVVVEPPRDPSHGDFATNAALVTAKAFGVSPREVGGWVADMLRQHPHVDRVEVVGPGFVNATLSPEFWAAQLVAMLGMEGSPGSSSAQDKSKPLVNVEYVSVNPTGPMHAGHGRVAVVGDVLANVLEKAGHAVLREYYINDGGGQADTLARSVYLRYKESLGRGPAAIPEGLYPGDYLIPVGAALAAKYGEKFVEAPESLWLDLFKKAAVAAMMDLIKKDLALIGIHHDIFTSEQRLVEDGKVDEAIAVLAEKGYVYEGVLDPPKALELSPGDEPWEPRSQLLFRSTAFGDDVDRVLKKSDGSWTYFAKDIAYHYDKYKRCGSHLIDVWGADHAGHVKRLQAAVSACIGADASRVDVVLCQMVNLLEGGEPLKMSKRSGVFVTLEEVVNRVGKDVVRLIMISRKNDAQLDFDFEKVLETTHDNPVFYIQYAHARCCSVLRQAAVTVPETVASLADGNPLLLTDVAELALLKKLTQWPRLIQQAAQHHEPHRVVYYLQEVAQLFHSLWNRGKEAATLRFIQENDVESTRARLMLVKATQIVVADGLRVCGVDAKHEM